MTRAACTTSLEELLEYWLGEVDEANESRLDEHLFGCAACAEHLRTIIALGAGIRGQLLGGNFGFLLPTPFVRGIKAAGLRVREYNVEPGDSVSCTATAEDDLVVTHLHAPLRDVRRLDVVIQDPVGGTLRARDVTFDPKAGNLTLVPSVVYLRTLHNALVRVRLVAVDGVDERVIADYAFNHSSS
jgi:Putative zinc-finger